jgi:hypothetical protein
MTSLAHNHNEIFLDTEGMVRFNYIGNQDDSSVRQAVAKSMQLIKQLHADTGLVDMWVDLRRMGDHTPAARRAALEALDMLPFRRMAVIISNTDPYTAKIAKIMASLSSRRKEIHFFKTETRAKKWLHTQE